MQHVSGSIPCLMSLVWRPLRGKPLQHVVSQTVMALRDGMSVQIKPGTAPSSWMLHAFTGCICTFHRGQIHQLPVRPAVSISCQTLSKGS